MHRIMTALTIFITGCFQQVGLPECGSEQSCPDHLPVCKGGHCFHYAIDYSIPLCGESGTSDTCCDLTTGDGCRLPPSPVTASAAYFLGDDLVYSSAQGTQWGIVAPDGTWQAGTAVDVGEMVPMGWMKEVGHCYYGDGALICCPREGDCQTRPLEDDLEGPLVGPMALCSNWHAAALAADRLVEMRGSQRTTVALDAGALPPGLGPIIHQATETIVAPTASGKTVTLVRAGEVVGTIAGTEIPGGLLGLALDDTTLYVAARDGRLLARQLDSDSGMGNDWQADLPQQAWTAGPVVSAQGDLLVVTADHRLLRINQGNRLAPDQTQWEQPHAPLQIVALHGGGVLGLLQASAQGEEDSAGVATLVPATLLPWLPAKDNWVRSYVTLSDCDPGAVDLARTTGQFVVVCPGQGTLQRGVVAAPLAASSSWPRLRGVTDSGCLLKDWRAPTDAQR